MVLSERKKASKLHIEQRERFERKYQRSILNAILVQYNTFLKDLKEHGVEYARRRVEDYQFNPALAEAFRPLYRDAAIYFAKDTDKKLQAIAKQKADGRLGKNRGWLDKIQNYLRSSLLSQAVVHYTQGTKNHIYKILNKGTEEGLSVDEMASRISPRLVMWKAQQITRTELGKAANLGRNMANNDFPFQVTKIWIASNDERTRPEHAEADGQEVEQNEDFNVGGENLDSPGDPRGSDWNIINCRCTCEFKARRDSNGMLIPKI
jgi:uncharacterized protein with gpF-like domain